MKKVAVIGAGITGITTAYYLVRAGYSVSVFEQERYPAMKCSYANGGQISVSNSEVWNTWTNVSKGLKWMFKSNAPLLIRPTIEVDKIKWLLAFLKHTVNNDYARNTAYTIQLGLESRLLYKDLIAEENLQFDQTDCGILHFYKNKAYFNTAVYTKTLYEANGCDWEIVCPDQIQKIEPSMRTSNIIGGAWTKTDWTGDIHKFCTQLSEILEKKYSVNFVYDTVVNDIDRLEGFDRIVVCNGTGAAGLSKKIGDRLNIYPVKGYSITITANDKKSLAAFPKVSLLDDEAKIVTSTLGNRLRVAGTAELSGENYDIRRDRIQPLINWVHTNFPGIDTRNYSSWACLRPMTPNMLPITKQSKFNKKVFYNTGHGHLGWTLSPATAKQVVTLIENE